MYYSLFSRVPIRYIQTREILGEFEIGSLLHGFCTTYPALAIPIPPTSYQLSYL